MKDRHIKFILLRNGMDQGTVKQRFTDEGLTILGKNSIQLIATQLENQDITKIYTPEGKKFIETATIISNHLNLTPIIDNKLKPRYLGLADGQYFRNIEKLYGELMKSSFSREFKFPNGETNGEVFERIGIFFKELLIILQGVKETILIISSPLLLNYFIYYLHNIGFKEGMLYVFEFAQYAVLESQSKYFQLTEFRKTS